MAEKPIAPNRPHEGAVGTADFPYAEAHIDLIYAGEVRAPGIPQMAAVDAAKAAAESARDAAEAARDAALAARDYN